MKTILLVLMCVFASGCSAEQAEHQTKEVKPIETPCDMTKKESVPSQVLVGTDVEDKSTFGKDVISSGVYRIDMGGASVKVEISHLNTLVRTYSEPGLDALVQMYENLCVQQNSIDGKGVRVLFVTDGILLWEQNPGDAMIPPNLWIYLKKEK